MQRGGTERRGFEQCLQAFRVWLEDTALFVVHGGESLNAYPEYRRVVIGDDGVARVPDAQIARRHRMQIGTIVSDASVTVQMRNGRKLGHVEESFIAWLTPGDSFVFAGRVLEFVRVREMTAWVKPAPKK